MSNQCSACGHPLNTLDDLVHHRVPNATPEELEVAKQHVRGFLRAAIRQFGNLPLPEKTKTEKPEATKPSLPQDSIPA